MTFEMSILTNISTWALQMPE